MKRIAFALLIAAAILGALFAADFFDPTSATAPNGEPVGAQHPKSERP
jgi:hypothetical protein